MTSDVYSTPWSKRYASQEMLHLFSDNYKYGLWRRLWVALAEAQKTAGLPITDQQIAQLRAHVDNIDFDEVQRQEEQYRHDVMAHVHAYGKQCPDAKGIIHLGATSCYVTDNGDVLQYRDALRLIRDKLTTAIAQLATFAEAQAAVPCIGLTHMQPAQVSTVGKRVCLWLQDLLMDLQQLQRVLESLRLLGVKGAVGTQASFLALLDGDEDKVQALEEHVAKQFDFPRVFTITGQTYPRKQDVAICHVLADISVSAHKFGTDVRLLTSRHELFEPFGDSQVGSSAMPYKRNPVLCERICSLARYGITLSHNSELTAALQWLERSLDDSANRRLTMPELFLCTDAVLNLILHVTKDLHVDEIAVAASLSDHLPFIATEAILMDAVRNGGDRQQLHERLRQHSFGAAEQVRLGKHNDLLDRISSDSAFQLSKDTLEKYRNPSEFVGRAPQQVREFLSTEVQPILAQFPTITTAPIRF